MKKDELLMLFEAENNKDLVEIVNNKQQEFIDKYNSSEWQNLGIYLAGEMVPLRRVSFALENDEDLYTIFRIGAFLGTVETLKTLVSIRDENYMEELYSDLKKEHEKQKVLKKNK